MTSPKFNLSRALPYLLFAVLALAPAAGTAAEPFVLIVNSANSVSRLEPQEVSNLFLKKKTAWPDGVKTAPVDLSESHPVRESFSKRIHGKSVGAIKAFWQKMIFSGQEVPPPEKDSPSEVVAFVRSRRGGIGYVPEGTPLGSGVKAVDLAQ
jgi:ABC-type phosphate transport system substrate-binding protein